MGKDEMSLQKLWIEWYSAALHQDPVPGGPHKKQLHSRRRKPRLSSSLN